MFKKHDCYFHLSDAILSPHYLLKLGNPLKIISHYKLDIYIRTVLQLYNRGDGPDTSECKILKLITHHNQNVIYIMFV